MDKNTSFTNHQLWNLDITNANELYKLVNNITASIENTTIWSYNSLLVDSEHFWTCPISIESDDISYMYAFRYNIKEKKMYGSPFKIKDDVYSLALNYSSNPSLFTIFNQVLSNIII